MRQGRLLNSGGEIGDERHAEYLHTGLTGGNRLESRGHSHDVTAHDAGHLHLGGSLVVRAAELRVDAFIQGGIDSASNVT